MRSRAESGSGMPRILRWTSWIAFAMVCAVVAGIVLVLTVLPRLTGGAALNVLTGSMTPGIPVGSVVLIRPVDPGTLRVGDVATYQILPDSHALVTHRIIAMRTQEDGSVVMRTQGDANPDPDPWKFTLNQPTQPVMKFSVPKVGHFFLFLADPQNRVLLIGIPAGLIALYAAFDLARALRRREDDAELDVPAALDQQPVPANA